MSGFFQKTTLSYVDTETRLNDRLSGLQVVSVQNGVSDTNRLYFNIFSQEHNQNYEFSIGTDNWIWRDVEGNEIPVLKAELDEHSMHPITNQIEEYLQNKLSIKKIELKKQSRLLKFYFSNNSTLEAREGELDEEGTHYQLMMFDSKLYQNYNLLIKKNDCVEQVTNGKEESGKYKVALFDLDYFREEHRFFTNNAIKQARLKKAPVSFIQAQVLYKALFIQDMLTFRPWNLRRHTVGDTRLDTISDKELYSITQEECVKNNFTVEEAKEILKYTILDLREWLKNQKNLEEIGIQEFNWNIIFKDLIPWYKEYIEPLN